MKPQPLHTPDRVLTLSDARRGFRGRVSCLLPIPGHARLDPDEMEKRLIEMGFIEGAPVEVLHEGPFGGPFGGDPIAVRIGSATVALRRRDARAILVE